MSVEVLFYFPLFILGLVAGFFYFTHLFKSINNFGTDKGKVLRSMIIRLPIPVIAVLIGSLAGIGGIISVMVGFTTFQIYFLVKVGTQLKKEVEEEAERLSQEENNLENK
ncbi:ATP synthase subunit I [Persephonella sp. KM09-Lau-8]|uniref:ATP synthase subunit I n=1 Tax=Persephonella sp. KM09-Lau-8 TaxID=1158345 RepID=UPI0004953BA8|nr:ATP synthase subunit I [Persephonella sp. KM09-Lau-8]